jgi:hypothetical protein
MLSKKKIVIVAVLISALAMGIAMPAIATWIGQSVVKITSSTATDTFTTTVAFVQTNASASPITMYGTPFTNGSTPGTVLGSSSGNPSAPSIVSFTASGFVPGDWIELDVTIKNTGTCTLQFTNWNYSCYFVNATTGLPITSGPWTESPYPPYSASSGPLAWTLASFGSDSTAAFLQYIKGTGPGIGWDITWTANNSYQAGSLPTTLAPGASFTYVLYVGLGVNVPYGIPNMYYSITVNMVPKN